MRKSVTYQKNQEWPQNRNNMAVNHIGGKAIENRKVSTKIEKLGTSVC